MSTNTMSNILLDKEILLESGTNELEVLVFGIGDYTFGINVAKVREVLPAARITNLPRTHNSIRGVFKLRDQVIPCVSLVDHLGIVSEQDNTESTLILSDFNQQQTAFLVDEVERIHRLSWNNILAVPRLDALNNTPVTALARCNDRLILMLDFEMILDAVTEQYFRTDTVDNPLGLPREKLRILFAEDSPTVREAIGNTLKNSGYTQVTFFDNGAEAWQWISRKLSETGCVEEVADLVISDVEMPQVDGFHLTKRIKGHAELKQLPVLLYSSIVTPDNRKKGNAVGADAQVAKPELKEVVRLADELISTAQRENRAAALRAVTDRARSEPDSTPRRAEETVEPVEPRSEVSATPPPKQDEAPDSTVDQNAMPETCFESNETEESDSPLEVPAPDGVDGKLWMTFHAELRGHADVLCQLLRRSEAGDRSDEFLREIGRTLHTIKSASMVIPLDQVTHCTHLAESLLEGARNDREKWPQNGLRRYLDWLAMLLSPPDDVNVSLAAGRQLMAEMAPQAIEQE